MASSKTPGGTLWTFDPRRAVKEAFKPVAHIGAIKAMAVANNRVYFIQGVGKDAGRGGDVRLKSITLGPDGPSPVRDYGLIQDQLGHRLRDAVMAADAQGRVYIIAKWFTLPGETGCIKGNMGGKPQDWRMLFAVVEAAP